jgi:hypothetical protein
MSQVEYSYEWHEGEIELQNKVNVEKDTSDILKSILLLLKHMLFFFYFHIFN